MNSPIASARLYLVAPVRLVAGTLAELVPELAAAGVDLVQLREKEMEAGDLVREGAPICDACRDAGIPFIVNDRPDVALALAADGVHLGQNDLPLDVARRIVGTGAIVGLSTHAASEIDAALRGEGSDYLSVGPVQETPTKPGRPGTGLDLVRYAEGAIAMPWFVTGGMAPATLPAAMEAGARRIVVVRAVTEAPDPVAAAARLREMLDEVPL
jgi:thiamine-phosphate pyrophosphorylase